MKRYLIGMLNYGSIKSFRYKGNTFSWFLADLSLYGTLFLSYIFLYQRYDSIGDYQFNEMMIYISTYTLINNLYAIVFSEAMSEYGRKIIDGTIYHNILMPVGILKSIVAVNFNVKALIVTPVLILTNIVLVIHTQLTLYRVLLYYSAIVVASLCMCFLFLLLNTLLFYGIRSESLQGVMMQLFSVAEKPDTFFHPMLRNVFIYLVPAFLFSAVPASIAISNSLSIEVLFLFVAPIILRVLVAVLYKHSSKYYKCEI